MTQDRPIPRSYWVDQDHVLAGEYPGSTKEEEACRKIEALLGAGISVFVNLTDEPDTVALLPYVHFLPAESPVSGRRIEHLRLPIRDGGVPTTAEMAEILDAIDAAVEQGDVVYFHCWGGIGRTGVVAGCYMVRHGRSGDEAIAEIARLREGAPRAHRPAPESGEQVRMVLNWAERDPKRLSPDIL